MLQIDHRTGLPFHRLLLRIGQLRILVNQRLDFILRELLLLAHSLCIDSRRRHALFDQELLHAVHTTLCKCLVELGRSTNVSMARQRDAAIGLDCQIALEVRCQCVQGLLLAVDQSAFRMFGGRLSGREEDAVQGQTSFESDLLRRRSRRRRWRRDGQRRIRGG